MDNKQSIEQLKSLREFQYKFINDERFVDTEKIKNDIEALNMAIKVLERTALEVPVQEQLIENIVERVLLNALGRFTKCI
ncbi:hypothetical protein [Clostridium butyricum]|uniref:hypothetical protein n=1 Tax=Clostridium butyricum TaxID=1492 RepID=UPI002AB00C75|nr:hypothetical protein [Clostridium butyricum]